MQADDQSDRELIESSGLFDAGWYSRRYPDVALSGLDPLRHYLLVGGLLQRDPHPLFAAKFYASEAGIQSVSERALLHYLRGGWRQGLSPHPLFDTAWYLRRHPDIAEAGIEPLHHFIVHGAFEEREPHPAFPISAVFDRCPFLIRKRINPLIYYICREWSEDPCPEATSYFARKERLRADLGNSNTFAFSAEPPPDHPVSTDVRAIAFYLPQFHAIPENDLWWGRGFTEWTNVRRATPQFAGHYQPHEPHPDLGYYDLNDPEVMEKQVAMARAAGLEGFCYYYYWFNGKRLLEMPTDRLLATEKPDFPFCFCWANENWTRTWDGGSNQILIGQEHSPDLDHRFIRDLLPAFRDPRYIRVNGRPLLLVYRPGLLPDFAASAARWREDCRRAGVGDLYLVGVASFHDTQSVASGLDAILQFPPLLTAVPNLARDAEVKATAEFEGAVYDYRELMEQKLRELEAGEKVIPGICPSWDNTARRMERGTAWIHSSPALYHHWLKEATSHARANKPRAERLLFINAWNEWAEGCHLEPDRKHGYAWIKATRAALVAKPVEANTMRPSILVVGHDAARAGAQIVLLTMLREWRSRGICDFKLILINDGVLRGDFELLGDTLVLSDFPTEEAKAKALRDFCDPAPDVILSNTVVTGPFSATLTHLRVPIVGYIHELQKSIERWAPGEIMQATVENSDHFIAVSEPVALNLREKHGIPAHLVTTLNPYIKTGLEQETAARESLREELALQPGEMVVFGCGTMDWRKGPDLFARVANQVIDRVPQARFVWIGSDTGDEASIRARAFASSPRISFIGERTDPRAYLPLGSAFFLSSREDPYPLVALEAADAGLPVVCFAEAGGIPDFVGSECGRTVPYENVEAAAEALVALLSDDEGRRSIGRAVQAKVRDRHDASKGSAAVLEVLRSLARSPGTKESPTRVGSGEEPLVTVVLPNYNHAKFLPERLASIANQTCRNLEILLLDDKSSDDSLDLLHEFAAREPRARLIANTTNSGSTFKQWRKGLTQAKGKYIWIAESDDSAHSELLTTLVARLEGNPQAMLAACCPRMTDLEGKDLGIPREWFSDIGAERWESDFSLPGRREIADVMAQKNAILNASGVVFRNTSGLVDLIDDSMRLCADWLFWVRLLARGDFEYVARPLNYWRLASSNARTKPPGEVEWQEGQKVLNEISELLSLKQSERNALLKNFKAKCLKWRQHQKLDIIQ